MFKNLKHQQKYFSAFVFSAIVVSVIILNIFCSSPKSTSNNVLQNYASLNDTVKYVGMDVCKQCHYEIYKTYIETGMGKSFDHASVRKSAADFGTATIFDRYQNFYYHAFWNKDSLNFMEFRLNGKDTSYINNQTVSFIVGSGQHTNSHIVNQNGYLYQAPMTFYTQKGKWDFPPGFENGNNTRFTRAIGLECISCHNSYPSFVKGSENKYTEIPNGITCERCHGPGEAHVKQIQQGVKVDTSKAIDYSIVNPAKLSIENQFDICQRCHIQGNAVLNKGKSFFDFRPGMKLSDVMNVFMPVFSGQASQHIMASHAERLKMSKCYTRTTEKISSDEKLRTALKPFKNAITCVTCHNPHVSVRQTGNSVFNTACKNCHSASTEIVCSEKTEVLNKASNNCVSCHMPKSGAIDIPHVSVTDHYIGKPVDENKIKEVQKFVTIACINNPNADNDSRGRAYIAYFEKFNMGIAMLDSAKKYFSDSSENSLRNYFDELIHIAFLEDDYKKVITYVKRIPDVLNSLNQTSYDNADAYTAYRIAQSFQNTDDVATAEIYYKRATDLAPFNLEMLNKYGSILAQQNKMAEAKIIFQKIVSENPSYSQGWCNLGFVDLSMSRNTEFAEMCYNRSLALNPDYEQAILNKAGLNAFKGDFITARKIIQDYLKRKPNSEKAKAILKQLMAQG